MKKIISFVFILALIIGLAACSNSEDKKKKTTTKKGEVKVAEMMQEDKQHLWFILDDTETNELTDESKVDKVVVTKNGKMKVYKVNYGFTITSVENDKIFDNPTKLVQSTDKGEFTGKKDHLIKVTKSAIDNTKKYINHDDDYKAVGMDGIAQTKKEDDGIDPKKTLKEQEEYLKELKKVKYSKPKWQKVNLKVLKNGNEAIEANRNFGFPKAKSSTGDDSDEHNYFIFNNAYQPIPLGDKDTQYAGLSYKEKNEDFNDQAPYLVTKISKKDQTVKMDEKDDPAIKYNKTKKNDK